MIVTFIQMLGVIALLLVVVSIFGAALATFIPVDLPAPARWALTPILGLAFGLGLFSSLNWFLPGNVVAFVGLVPALVVAIAVLVWRRSRFVLPGIPAWPLAVVVLLVAGAYTAPLAYQSSMGPGG